MKEDIETLRNFLTYVRGSRIEALAALERVEKRIHGLEADWRETIRANAEECCSLTAERDALRAELDGAKEARCYSTPPSRPDESSPAPMVAPVASKEQ